MAFIPNEKQQRFLTAHTAIAKLLARHEPAMQPAAYAALVEKTITIKINKAFSCKHPNFILFLAAMGGDIRQLRHQLIGEVRNFPSIPGYMQGYDGSVAANDFIARLLSGNDVEYFKDSKNPHLFVRALNKLMADTPFKALDPNTAVSEPVKPVNPVSLVEENDPLATRKPISAAKASRARTHISAEEKAPVRPRKFVPFAPQSVWDRPGFQDTLAKIGKAYPKCPRDETGTKFLKLCAYYNALNKTDLPLKTMQEKVIGNGFPNITMTHFSDYQRGKTPVYDDGEPVPMNSAIDRLFNALVLPEHRPTQQPKAAPQP